jgi:hypothetical protein
MNSKIKHTQSTWKEAATLKKMTAFFFLMKIRDSICLIVDDFIRHFLSTNIRPTPAIGTLHLSINILTIYLSIENNTFSIHQQITILI